MLPGRLQRLQVSLCSSLNVPAGKLPVKHYLLALWHSATSRTSLVGRVPQIIHVELSSGIHGWFSHEADFGQGM